MSDSFFGFDTSLSNINDDDGGGGDGSEDEYDALNDETFGHERDDQDWEIQHELVAEQLESSRRHNSSHNHSFDDTQSQLEASLSQLVLDETDAPSAFGSNVWRHDPPPVQSTAVPGLKNVHTVEELERQLRLSGSGAPPMGQNYYQPRFPPGILQRPPGLQAPVPMPFAQQPIGQMNQQLNNIIGPNSQMGPNNQMGQITNQMGQINNQMGQINNQIGPINNQMGPIGNQMGHQMNQLGNQMMGNNLTQNVNQFMQNSNQFQNSQLQNMQVNQNNQIGNQMNPIGNQMVQNGNQFGSNMNQFQHNMMNQPRMMGPPPGINMPPMQNFNPNVGFNPNFRVPTKPSMEQPPMNQQQQNIMINQQMMQQNMQQIKTQSPQINQHFNQINQLMNQNNQTLNQVNHQVGQVNQQLNQVNQPLNQGNQQLNQVNQQLNQGSQQKNQLNQNSPQQQKMQKQRVIYNSNQKNMTSENLVQFIQNTHPILQLQQQQTFHNAHHHPMLNNRPSLPYNNQVGTHPLLNQRNNGSFSNNNRHLMNGDEVLTNGSPNSDSYSGLMTSREKQWLINIQMLQLNTGTPYIHDFYYTVFLERQSKKEKEGVKEAHKANQQNHPFYSGGVKQETHRERHNSARHNSLSEDGPRAYVPTQFENSLGKLQCGSVTAPRKIIDVEVVENESTTRASRAPSAASAANPSEVPREMRRTKQLLLDIEALYLILLRLEELTDPLAISNALILKEREEKQRQLELAAKEAELDGGDDTNLFLRNIESVQRRPKTDSPKHDILDKRQVVNLTPLVQNPTLTTKNLLDENKDDLMNRMFAGLLHEDRLQQFLLVRKGKKLIYRFMARAASGTSQGRMRAVWMRILRGLPAAARRDDGTMGCLAGYYRDYIQNSTGWASVLESCSILSEAFDPARTPYALTSSLTMSCVCTLIEKSSTLVNTPEATSNERLWTKFLKTFARALKNTTLTVAKPIKPISESKLTFHIKQLESRNTIEILQRGKTAAEFADLSKSEFSQLLISHLC